MDLNYVTGVGDRQAPLLAASAARRSAGAKARWAREKGQEVIADESSAITRESLTVNAASAVGMCRQRYKQEKGVVEAAEQEAEKFEGGHRMPRVKDLRRASGAMAVAQVPDPAPPGSRGQRASSTTKRETVLLPSRNFVASESTGCPSMRMVNLKATSSLRK